MEAIVCPSTVEFSTLFENAAAHRMPTLTLQLNTSVAGTLDVATRVSVGGEELAVPREYNIDNDVSTSVTLSAISAAENMS